MILLQSVIMWYVVEGLSVSLQLKRPEVMLFANIESGEGGVKHGQALLLRTEFLLDYSRHPGHDNLACSLSGLHIVSNSHKPYMVSFSFMGAMQMCNTYWNLVRGESTGNRYIVSTRLIYIILLKIVHHIHYCTDMSNFKLDET